MNNRSVSLAVLFVFILLPVLLLAQGNDNIDWDRARDLFQRSNRGEQLSPADQAYLDHAKQVHAAMQANGGGQGGQPHPAISPVGPVSGLVPLTDLSGTYKGEGGGLYGSGRNDPPPELAAAAKSATAKIQPLDSDGKPSASGKIVLLSIGMSNTTMEFSRFMQLAQADQDKSPLLVIVDGAQGGQTADRIAPEDAPFWKVVDQRLAAAGVTRAQVQAAWIKEANAGPKAGFPNEAQHLKDSLAKDVAVAKKLYPNLGVVYLSSRIYAGYATTQLNPEPYAYEGAFAVRWLIQDQMKEGVHSPVMLWGPYLWADGTKGRKIDSLVWNPGDFGGDGTHPSETGRQKVAEMLLKFFKTDPNARNWFVKK